MRESGWADRQKDWKHVRADQRRRVVAEEAAEIVQIALAMAASIGDEEVGVLPGEAGGYLRSPITRVAVAI